MAATYEELMLKARELKANGDTASAKRVARIALMRREAPSQANTAVQAASGFNEGLADIAGAPVDLVTRALNLGARGINAVAGTDIQPITDPVGGSADMRALLAPTIADAEPQTAAQRYARRIGQEAGAMAIPGGAMMRTAQAPLKLAGMEAASTVGAGVAGQASQEIAPGNETADMIASMLGGLSPAGASRALRPSPKAPTLEEVQAQADAGYDYVRDSGATLSPQSADTLASGLEGALGPRPATRRMNPKAAIASSELAADMRQNPMTISEVDEARQWIGSNVAGSREPGERRLGMMMKDTIDGHLSALQPSDITGTNMGAEVVEALTGAREKASRIHKSAIFEAEDTGAFDRGLNRAATTGTGGNEVNAIRQNVRRVLENPKLRRGFKEHELQAMRELVQGTPTQNAMRILSGMAPNKGALPLLTGAGVSGAGVAALGPAGALAGIVPSAIGAGAKAIGERSAKRQAEALGELIRNGKPLPKKGASDLEKRLIAAVLAKQTAATAEGGADNRSAVIRAMLEGQTHP